MLLSFMRKLETERLLLRSYKAEDFDFMYNEILGKKEVMEYLLTGKALNEEESRAFIEKYFAKEDEMIGLGTLCDRATGKPIGYGGIIHCDFAGIGDNEYEIAFALCQEAWGKGYALEVGKRELEEAFRLIPSNRILVCTHPQNVKSIKTINALDLKIIKKINDEKRGPRNVYFASRLWMTHGVSKVITG